MPGLCLYLVLLLLQLQQQQQQPQQQQLCAQLAGLLLQSPHLLQLAQ